VGVVTMENLGASKPQSEYPGGTRGTPLLLIAAAALAMVVPFCFLGIPSGHDFEFHLNSWIEVLSQWRQGIIYPRWAALAHYGYGDARFIFYPPTSWVLGAALGAVLPWKLVPAVYQWLALALSGCSMFLLARRWMSRRDAIFAAALYAVNPYYVLIVYWRSAFAELLAGALLPLLPLYLLESDEEGRKAIVPMALIMSAAFLTNVPAAVMVSYSLALLALIFAVLRRSPKIMLYSVVASVLGVALAAFYLLPTFYEQRWINISQVLSPGVRPQDNFLFTTTADPDHNRFNQLVSVVATAELIVLALAAFLSRKHWSEHAWRALLLWGSTCGLLMFSMTGLFWSYLPWLRFLQFPWRWLLCLNVALVVLLTMASKRWRWRAPVLLFMLGALVVGWHRVQPPWWDNARDVADMLYQQQNGDGYEGTDEYAPVGADPYNIDLHAPKVASENGALLRVQVEQWSPEAKLFLVDAAQPDKLVLRLFNYPAWRVDVNGHTIRAETRADTGQMMIPIAEGENRVQIAFVRTWDRTAGAIISLVSAVGLLLWSSRKRFGNART
jgi:6-pyruvoyl-tetrahydropterin synthase related domain